MNRSILSKKFTKFEVVYLRYCVNFSRVGLDPNLPVDACNSRSFARFSLTNVWILGLALRTPLKIFVR